MDIKYRFSKVSRRMWNDAAFRELSHPPPNGQTLWVRLLTGPELTNIPGLFPAWASGLAEALHWTTEGFDEAFREVMKQGLAKADWEVGLVWIPNAIVHNKPEAPNVVRSWKTTWADLPECQLKLEAYHRLKTFADGMGNSYPKAFAEACPKPSPKARAIQEQEQEQEQDKGEIPRVSFRHTAPKGAEGEFSNLPDSDVRLKVAKGRTSKSKPRSSTKATIPEDWKPSERCLELLAAEGIQDGVALACLPDFRDYWRSERGLKADWDATFRQRVRWLKNQGRLPSPMEAPSESSYIEIVQGKRVRQYVRNGAVVRSEPAEQDSQRPLPEVV